MKKPATVQALEKLGRVRLSPSFFMRDFLHSEIAEIEGVANIPDDPDLAVIPLPPAVFRWRREWNSGSHGGSSLG